MPSVKRPPPMSRRDIRELANEVAWILGHRSLERAEELRRAGDNERAKRFTAMGALFSSLLTYREEEIPPMPKENKNEPG